MGGAQEEVGAVRGPTLDDRLAEGQEEVESSRTWVYGRCGSVTELDWCTGGQGGLMGKLASVSYKINLVQLMETSRIAVRFEIPEKDFCSLPLQLCSGREPWRCPSSTLCQPWSGVGGTCEFLSGFLQTSHKEGAQHIQMAVKASIQEGEQESDMVPGALSCGQGA